MRRKVGRALWLSATPVRAGLLALIWMYRRTLSGVMGGRCRFHPTCSAYAAQAIRESGVVRGVALSVWRVARCSPLSAGGVDYPPRRRIEGGAAEAGGEYDAIIHPHSGRGFRLGQRVAP
jgi:putative membrane protein insertion efficiency factor